MSNFDLNVNKEELEKRSDELVKKKVQIPSGALCRFLIYDVATPKKAKDEAAQFRTKITLLNGLDIRLAALGYYEEKKFVEIINYSNPNNITFPLGETGFKNTLFFRCSEKALAFHGFNPVVDEADVPFTFNLWLHKVLGIPIELDKNTLAGTVFNSFRYWQIREQTTESGTERRYSSEVSAYSKELKARLTEEQLHISRLTDDVTAAIWRALNPNDDLPF